MLEAGGNAIDAAAAAALVCFAAEPLLASAGGAGVMVVAPAGRPSVAVDFFSPVPGRGLDRMPALDFAAIEVDFGGARQSFHVGRGSATVPMVLDGLAVAAREFGNLPLRELAGPAIELARDGVVIDPFIARTFVLLWSILLRDPRCMAEVAFGLPCDRPPRVGDRMRNPTLAETLAAFAEQGGTPAELRRGLLDEFGPAQGGLITADDLATTRVELVEPHRIVLGDWTIATSPRSGGRLVGRIAEHLLAGPVPNSELDSVFARARASLAGHQARSQIGSTTHVSVVDELGNAATVTLTSGEGCGHVVTGTGVHVNNFLGEEDLNPGGFHRHAAGSALPTMIAPTIARHSDGRIVALGSGGSNRIRSAVAHVLVGVIRGASIEQAVAAPRVHAEETSTGTEVWLELADLAEPDAIRLALADEFGRVHGFADRDFFFGGVHTVELDARGRLQGVGDDRRFGVTRTSS